MLLAIVGVDGSLALDGGAEVLHGIGRGRDHAAVFLEYAHVRNLDALVGRVVAKHDLPPLLDAGFALHPHARDRLLAAGAVRFKPKAGKDLFNDKGFLGVVFLFLGGFGGGSRRGHSLRLLGGQGREEAGYKKGERCQTTHR